MFADPQSVTVNAVAQSLPAISRDENASIYRKEDAAYKLSVMHVFGNRNRFTARLDAQKIAADPLASANNLLYTMSAYLVINVPLIGYSNTEAKDVTLGLIGWATSANLLKVLGGET